MASRCTNRANLDALPNSRASFRQLDAACTSSGCESVFTRVPPTMPRASGAASIDVYSVAFPQKHMGRNGDIFKRLMTFFK